MGFGFLKSGRAEASPRDDCRATTISSQIIQQVEELGVGMFWATDAAGAINFLSQQALREFESAGTPVIGEPLTAIFHDAETLPGAGSQRALSFKCKTQSRIDDHIVELRLSRPGSNDKSSRWWRISGRAMTTPEGEFIGYRGSAIDITSQ